MATEVNFRLAAPDKPIILVPTVVNGHGPFEFVLDTGASVTVVSAAVARRVGINRGDVKEAAGCGAGGKLELATGRVKSLAIGGAKLENLQVAIADLGALSRAVGAELEGIVGYNYLKDFKVAIDYPRASLRLE